MKNVNKILAGAAVRFFGFAFLVFFAAQQLTIHAAEIPTETLAMELDMTVRVLGQAGDAGFQKVVDAGPGSTVEFQIHFRNTSTITVDDVQVAIVLPDGIRYVTGTTVLFNTNNPYGIIMSDGLALAGINIGSYLPYGDAFVRFWALVPHEFELEYGWSQFIARGRAGFALNDFGMRESIATVNVYKSRDRFVPDSLFRTLLMLLTPIMSYR